MQAVANTSGRLLDLLSLLQARRDWPGDDAGRAARRLGPHDPPRHRAAARARVPRRVGDRAGRRLPAAGGTAMPPLLLDEDEAIAIAVGLRHGRPRIGDRHRGDLRARARQARAGAAGAPPPPGRGVRVGDGRGAGHRADRRPPAPDDDRRGLPRRGVPPVPSTAAATGRDPPRRRAARAREPRPALVPRGVGPPPRGLAHVPRRPARRPAPTGGRFTPRRRCRRRTPRRYVEQSIAGPPTATRRA